jgi:outer membrane protein TolC
MDGCRQGPGTWLFLRFSPRDRLEDHRANSQQARLDRTRDGKSSRATENVRLSLHAEVAIDYFEVRSADTQQELLDDTVKAYAEALELTKNRFEGGVAPRADVTEAQTQLNTTLVQASDIMVQRSRTRVRRQSSSPW